MDNAVKFDKDVSRAFLNSISDDSVSLNDKISRIGKSVHIECSGLSILRYYDRRRASIQNMLIPELESRYNEELAKEQMAYGWEAR